MCIRDRLRIIECSFRSAVVAFLILRSNLGSRTCLLYTSTYGGNSTRELDLQLANLLADLGDRFALNELREEACECYSRSIMARIRAKNLDNATRRNLVTISSNALISKIYNPALEQFRRVNKFLEYSDDLAFYGNVRDLALYGNVRICSQSQSHLLEQLVDPDSKLDQASFSALKLSLIHI